MAASSWWVGAPTVAMASAAMRSSVPPDPPPPAPEVIGVPVPLVPACAARKALPWPECFPLDGRLPETAKHIVGLARAVPSRGKQPMLTEQEVAAVKGDGPWTHVAVQDLHATVVACQEFGELADGKLHTAKDVPGWLVDDIRETVKIEVRFDWAEVVWKWSAARKSKAVVQGTAAASTAEAKRLMDGLRDVFNDTNQLRSKINILINNGKEPSVFGSVATMLTQPLQAIQRYRAGGLVIGPGTGTSRPSVRPSRCGRRGHCTRHRPAAASRPCRPA